jgi:COX assembly protein 2
MHPQLSDRKIGAFISIVVRAFSHNYLVCQEFIKALEDCHANGLSRFTGACNRQKDELNHCLRSEVSVAQFQSSFSFTFNQRLKRTSANREAAKARKAKADQAFREFYEE